MIVAAALPSMSDLERIARLERENATLTGAVVTLTTRLHDAESAFVRLRSAYTHALEQLHLMRLRLFVAKAERRDTSADQLAFDSMFEQVERLKKEIDTAEDQAGSDDDSDDSDDEGKKRRKPKGRRKLSEAKLPEVRVEVPDPELEGKAERIGFDESYRLGYERGGMRRIVLARVVYKVSTPSPEDVSTTDVPATTPTTDLPATHVPATTPTTDLPATHVPATTPTTDLPATHVPATTPTTDLPATPATAAEGAFRIVTTPLPKELFRRGMLAPSMIAHLLVTKYMMGVPFYRLEQKFNLEGVSLDRGTMCRYAEDAGATLGAIVEAARTEAFKTAFCLSTDATGVSIQPGPVDDRGPRPCRKAHFFVVLADRDHVFFEYQSKHTSAVACAMFKGFTGYIQADAHAIYDALFDGRTPRGQPPDPTQGPPPIEVGCWSHARRNFWEAAVCKYSLGLEGLRRIDAIFATDRLLKDLAPAKRKAHRDQSVRPLVDAFFAWVHAQHAAPRERGLVATALGYALNQEQPLRRFLDDGRLRLENNASERALRTIATGRNAWLFFGSDDHASAAANLFSLIASCKLHRLDPESYLADVIRVMPYWPRDRYIELAPKYWARTRARLDATEMARPLGHITVPLPPEKEGAAN